eukprot:c26672_g1_i1 orf=363-2654(-)
MVAAEPTSLHPSGSLLVVDEEKKRSSANGMRTESFLEKSSTGVRRHRNAQIAARHKSPTISSSPSPASSGRRFPTPNVDRIANTSDGTSSKRSQSAERRRPSTSESKVSNSSIEAKLVPRRVPDRPDLLWPSSRSIQSSTSVESCSPMSEGFAQSQFDGRGKSSSKSPDHTLKASVNMLQRSVEQRKATPGRKGTPLRRQSLEQAENARPLENVASRPDRHRWPATSNGKMFGAALSKSVDLTLDRVKPMSRAATLLVQGKPILNSASRVPRPVASSRALFPSINEGPAAAAALALPNATSSQRPDSRGRTRSSPYAARKASSCEVVQSIGILQHVELSKSHERPAIRQSEREAEPASANISLIADNVSDTESVSSGNTAATPSARRGTAGISTARVTRGSIVPARYWDDAANRSSHQSDSFRLRSSVPESDLATAAVVKASSRQKATLSSQIQSGSNAAQGFVPSSPWSMSPNRSMSAFSSPARSPRIVSPVRSLPSSARLRASTLPLPLPGNSQTGRSSSAAAMLSFGVGARKGKKGMSQLEEAHFIRILHNRLLQWRFVNARAAFAMDSQRVAAEKLLLSVWARTYELRASATVKRIQLQQARQAHKLNCILSTQAPRLEDWSSLQQEHSIALSGAIQALEAAILRVPVTGGVRADTQAVKEAICSAVDVMVAVGSSIAYLLPKVDKTNNLVSELAQVAANEKALVEECGYLLATAAAYEVEESSLRTHVIQFAQEKARVLGHLMDSTKFTFDSVSLSSP